MDRRYAIYDVFTEVSLAGNPLVVVFDGDGLSDADMLAIAGEFNLSETVFVCAPKQPAHVASLRIFTISRELPFAGHPTVGTAVALAEESSADRSAALDLVQVMQEQVGPVRCAVRLMPDAVSFAEFDLPRKSSRLNATLDHQKIADAFGLSAAQIGFENHIPCLWSAGVPFVLIPVHDLDAVQTVAFDPERWLHVAPLAEGHLASAYVYCRGGVHHAASFHARMFAPEMGLTEDPATGSAVAALSGAIHDFDQLIDGHYPLMVEQGVEMGRPSYIHLHLDVKGGEISAARIGGSAMRVTSGVLNIGR